MKQIIGIEYFNVQEDFLEGIAKMKAILKDGDECDMVYISQYDENEYDVIAKGKFIPNKNFTGFNSTIIFNKKLLKIIGIDMRTLDTISKRYQDEIKLLPK